MKAAIYNPYLDTLGGGEKYTISFAQVLAEEGYHVDIEWNSTEILDKLSKRFGLKLSKNINIVNSVNRGENYDICFWVSDGSIPTLKGRFNVLHFQVPFKGVNGNSLLNKMKFFRINRIVCNSKFTKDTIDEEFGQNSVVVYPPVEIKSFRSKRKESIILYVGRFSGLVQNKGHEVLIDAFGKLSKVNEFSNWKLILAGGVEVGNGGYLDDLIKKAKGLKVEFFKSPDFNTLKDLYGKAKIFWSATGFEVNEDRNPENTEHFGMTLVESMAAGCVPIAYNAGGHKETISPGQNGYLWETKRELINVTKKVIKEKGLIRSLSKNAVESSFKYSYEVFKQKVITLLK